MIASMRSAFVTKYAEMYPRSICMPSTYSFSNSRPLDSSTVMTPSRPTLSWTSAMSSPISVSAAEIPAMCAISSLPLTSTAWDLSSATTASTPFSRPRFRSIGLAPAAMFFRPSVTIACAMTTEVVVPSPAMSFVLVAASLRSCAPMFSNGFSSSISRATVTPSWVTVGAPNFLSTATLRPLGPSVVFTAFAILSTPALREARASCVNSSCFAILASLSLRLDDREDVLLAEDQELLVVELEFGAGVLLEQDAIAFLELDRDARAGVGVAIAGTDREDLALLGLLLRGVRQDDPALRHLLALEGFDDDAGAERLELELERGLLCDCCWHVAPPYPVRVLAKEMPGFGLADGLSTPLARLLTE